MEKDEATGKGDETVARADAGEPSEGLDRRKFLHWSWRVLGLGLVVEAGWTTYDILNPSQAKGFGGAVDAGSLADYPDGTVRYFLDGRFYVTSYQGGLRALYQKCPHLGCKVPPFCESSSRFECPCHGSLFNITGEYLGGPAPRGLDRFPIKIDGDRVIVDTSSVVEGPPRGILEGPSEATGASCLGEPSGPMPGGMMSPDGGMMSPGGGTIGGMGDGGMMGSPEASP